MTKVVNVVDNSVERGESMVSERMFEVAKYFIYLANSKGDTITNLKLQKLMYYAQAWYMVFNNGKPLFDGDFQAWALGPAIPELYREYKKFGRGNIELNLTNDEEKLNQELMDLEPDIIEHLDNVYDRYGHMEAFELSQLTHRESPWINARNHKDALEFCTTIITKDSMIRYYSELVR
ncbi:MAG TPA: DUF4065 domain-containing protein [Caldisericia bacterium]|nr:DUF4065 domain-containing protein [Caldisericia bacterium]